MKTFKFIFLLAFVSVIFVSLKASSQAVKTVEPDVTLTIQNSAGTVILTLYHGEGLTIETENGNYLYKISFNVKDYPELMNFAGPNLFLSLSLKDEEGNIFVCDELAVVTRSGNLKFTFHINGSGNNLPHGWFSR